MGRTREFDIESAIESATQLFWKKGYDRTSLSDLTAAMHITPTSLYFAFGNKENLFRTVVDRYYVSQTLLFEDSFREATVRGVAEKFLYGYADLLTDPSHAPGCLVVNSTLPCAADDSVRTWLTERREQLFTRLRKRFSKARELPLNFDPSLLARYIAVLAWGMAVEAQAGITRKELYSMIAAALSSWPSQASEPIGGIPPTTRQRNIQARRRQLAST